MNPPVTEARAAIETHGRWAVVVSWEASDNDVDSWLATPSGATVSWVNPRNEYAHLEQDDLGYSNDTPDGENRERLVIRSVEAGEYVANLHCYACYDTPIEVTVVLWRLQGADTKVKTERITLTHNAQEETVFRFRLDEAGALQDLNRLPARIVTTQS